MATARKLPSGNYRCRIFVGKKDGKSIYKSFTAPTKKQAEYEANKYLVEQSNKRKEPKNQKTFSQALGEYIESKTAVLSPATIRGYKSLEHNFHEKFPEFCKIKLSEMTNSDVQKVVNQLTATCSPKTVRNYHGLISTIVGKEIILSTTMPQKTYADINIPTDEDIANLIKAVENTEMEIPILLGAFCMMRRGEICGLTMQDIKGNTIHIHHSMVMGADRQWHLKAPKTTSSDRYIQAPDFIISKIKKQGYVTTLKPDHITTNFLRILKRNNIPIFRFHDLRHYSASIRHALGIPDAYIMADGGWKTDGVLKTVYRHAMKDKMNEMQALANNHFEKLYDTKYDTK